jgi:hypothetical protein
MMLVSFRGWGKFRDGVTRFSSRLPFHDADAQAAAAFEVGEPRAALVVADLGLVDPWSNLDHGDVAAAVRAGGAPLQFLRIEAILPRGPALAAVHAAASHAKGYVRSVRNVRSTNMTNPLFTRQISHS